MYFIAWEVAEKGNNWQVRQVIRMMVVKVIIQFFVVVAAFCWMVLYLNGKTKLFFTKKPRRSVIILVFLLAGFIVWGLEFLF